MANISDKTRKLLWDAAGGRCAHPDCEKKLVASGVKTDAKTVIGVECHIVSRRDHASVARSESSLTEDEKREFADLIEHRDSYRNLLLLCGDHHAIIDDPAQKYSVADVVDMKSNHELEVVEERRLQADVRRGVGPTPEAPLPEEAATVVFLEDVGDWEQKALRALKERDPPGLTWMLTEVGTPVDTERLLAIVESWPPELANGPEELALVAIRMCESRGEWLAATVGWRRLSDQTEDVKTRADHLVRAAIAAETAGDSALHSKLLAKAEELDPDSARLKVQQIASKDLEPAQELVELAPLQSTDDALQALVHAHRALAHLLLKQIDEAEQELASARKLEPDAIQVRTLDVNVRVQRARIAMIARKPVDTASLIVAKDEALATRDRLLAMGRFEEASRVLMLAAEIPAMLRDESGASLVLALATEEEIATNDGPHVLGDAALRVNDAQLALRFTDGHSDPASRRIRATASLAVSSRDSDAALKELEHLALHEPAEAELAAVARLGACLPPLKAEWDDDVAKVLESQYSDTVKRMRAMAYLSTANYQAANTILDGLPDDASTREVRLRAALAEGKNSAIKESAEALLKLFVGPQLQLLAGRALLRSGDPEIALDSLKNVARDLNAPPNLRADAYASSMYAVAATGDWELGKELWGEWQRLCANVLGTNDDRVSAWQVRILHRTKPRQFANS